MTTGSTILTRGMAAQLNRVNQSPARLMEQVADLERQIERRDQIIRDLRAQLAAYQAVPEEKTSGEGFKTITDKPFPLVMHAGRPAATAAQIALLHNVNISNVYRQLQKNKLAGAFVNGHWIVYTDQDIRFKSYRRRS